MDNIMWFLDVHQGKGNVLWTAIVYTHFPVVGWSKLRYVDAEYSPGTFNVTNDHKDEEYTSTFRIPANV